MIKFSVIIPDRKISDFLKENILELKKVTYANFEVIIITDNAETYDFGNDARFILTDSHGDGNPGLKRNIGAKLSSGDVLAFLDDDAYPRSDWLDEAAKIFADDRVYALGGPAITPKDVSLLELSSGYILKSWLASGETTYRHNPKPEREIADYPTVNLFVRKSAFEKINGFSIEFWPGEDTKLCLDLVKLYRRKFLYSPNPVVYHHRRTVFKPHLKQISRYGRHRGQYARIFPETSRLLSYFMPSLFVLGLLLGSFTYFFSIPLFKVYVGTLAVYLACVILESLKAFLEGKKPGMFFLVALGIILTHIVYGVSFVLGYIKKPKLVLKVVDNKSGNYSEG